jgi:hypothetical protein
MPIARSCMTLRMHFPKSVKNDIQWFLEQNMIIIIGESTDIKYKADLEETLGQEPDENSIEKISDIIEENIVLETRDINMYFDVKVDPELFRKVEETLSTIANGTYVLHREIFDHFFLFGDFRF